MTAVRRFAPLAALLLLLGLAAFALAQDNPVQDNSVPDNSVPDQPAPDQPAQDLTLILDSPNQPGLPRRFRSASDSLPLNLADPPDQAGLTALRLSGSAQFSRLQLSDLVDILPRSARPLFVVDLRQESHGFISGQAVSWYGPRDWANQGKTPEQVEADEAARLEAAQAAGQVRVAEVLRKDAEDRLADSEPFTLTVTSVQSEAQVMALHGLGYLRLPVPDHLRPDDAQVEAFLAWWAALPPGAWVHFHCHAGDGRTTTFMLMADILANAQRVGLEEMARRQHLLGGMDLLGSPPDNWKRQAYLERADFIRRFHEFVRAQGPGQAGSWLAWTGAAQSASPAPAEPPTQGPDPEAER